MHLAKAFKSCMDAVPYEGINEVEIIDVETYDPCEPESSQSSVDEEQQVDVPKFEVIELEGVNDESSSSTENPPCEATQILDKLNTNQMVT